STGGFTSSTFDGAAWGAFKNVAGATISGPGCGTDTAGAVICVATTTTSWNVVAARFNGTAWTKFINLGGGSATDKYTCTTLGGTFGNLSCYARGTNLQLFGNNFKGGTWATTSWSGWASLGGTIAPGSSCSQVTTGQLACASSANDA